MQADFHRPFVERVYYSEVSSFPLFLVTVPEVLAKIASAQLVANRCPRKYETYAPCGEKLPPAERSIAWVATKGKRPFYSVPSSI